MRNQRVRVNSHYSSWSKILSGGSTGIILGPLLFNIYLADLFIFIKDINIVNYADDNTPYAIGKDVDSVIKRLENESLKLFEWLRNISLKANTKKSHLLLNSTDLGKAVSVGDNLIYNENVVKLLGITFDNTMSFHKHVSGLCKRASKKIHILARIAKYMGLEKRRMIMKSFILSQFGYCPLIWISHSRGLNNRINRLHERSLRIAYQDNVSSFEELLKRDNSVTIHERNIQSLAIELFKTKNRYTPAFMNNIFTLKMKVLYCSEQIFMTRNVCTVHNGTEAISYLGPKIWLIILIDIKDSMSLENLKGKLGYGNQQTVLVGYVRYI